MVEHVKIERLMINKKLYFKGRTKAPADSAPENASDFKQCAKNEFRRL